ncbi:hypothetical protein A8C56_18785 [Niabella ginsenosidivorans]|uniref:Uncharacterized protein n=1 Tax=Niabella ginsenosidivorans TaxID=1176587 RepID=A0A1A9I7R7_9BACT|nr:hypothetical protein [Niabella ginsenosidivorans]ANH82750.1 hypothetical protein A8C56_18785 [Niabella ginsenosidivorans]
MATTICHLVIAVFWTWPNFAATESIINYKHCINRFLEEHGKPLTQELVQKGHPVTVASSGAIEKTELKWQVIPDEALLNE